MNRLDHDLRSLILTMLVEGSSMRSVHRATGVSFNTVNKLLVDAGNVCADFHDKTVNGVKCARVQCDEIWSFCYAKEKNVPAAKCAPIDAGDLWTWTAFDPDSKLIISYWLGDREYIDALVFLSDLYIRLTGRVQISTDGLRAYRQAMGKAFNNEVDFAQTIKKILEKDKDGNPKEIEVKKRIILGNPDKKHISTSLVERQNLTMRMCMRRYTRKTNAFSKKVENHMNMLNVYFVWYNFCRKHTTIKTSPAMRAGLVDELYDMDFIVDLVEAVEDKQTRKRGPYRKRRK